MEEDEDVGASAEPPTPCASFRCSLQDNYQDLERFLFCESRRHLVKQLKEAGGLFESLLRRPEDTKIAEIIPKVLIGLLREFHEKRCIARSSSWQENQARSSDTEVVCDFAELDALAQFIPADLSPAQLDPFSHLPLPPIPTDIVNSLDWLASNPNTNFDTFFKPPSVVPVPDVFSDTTMAPFPDQRRPSELVPSLPSWQETHSTANPAVVEDFGSKACPVSLNSADTEVWQELCRSSTASIDTTFSRSTNSYLGSEESTAETDLPSSLYI